MQFIKIHLTTLSFFSKIKQIVISHLQCFASLLTGLSPNEGELERNAEHTRLMHEKYYAKIKPTRKARFKVGDYVRISFQKRAFWRGYQNQALETIYKVSKVINKFQH